MQNQCILVVEDEAKIAQLLVDYLQQAGYETQVLLEGSQAVETVRELQPALVLLDLMLPGKDGLTICREVRQFSEVPIVMVTARVDEIDRLLGLELGADDYVCKPFLPREVVARVKTILRRVKQVSVATQADTANAGSNLLHYRGISLLPDQYLCRVNDNEVSLTPVEFRMLQTLIAKPGKVYSRDSLMRQSYQDERIVSGRTIDSHIKNLRRKISQAMQATDSEQAQAELIHSIYGVGYKVE